MRRKNTSAPSDWKRSCRRMARFRALVDDLAVENVGDAVAVADAFERVPLADRLFDVVLAAKALDVLPVRIAAPPVDSPSLELLGLALRIVIPLFAAHLDRRRQAPADSCP